MKNEIAGTNFLDMLPVCLLIGHWILVSVLWSCGYIPASLDTVLKISTEFLFVCFMLLDHNFDDTTCSTIMGTCFCQCVTLMSLIYSVIQELQYLWWTVYIVQRKNSPYCHWWTFWYHMLWRWRTLVWCGVCQIVEVICSVIEIKTLAVKLSKTGFVTLHLQYMNVMLYCFVEHINVMFYFAEFDVWNFYCNCYKG